MILITRPKTESKLLQNKLADLGYASVIESLSSFKFNKQEINNIQKKIILISSPRATKILLEKKLLRPDTLLLVIGKSSALRLKKSGLKNIIYTASNSELMLKYIKRNFKNITKNGSYNICYCTSNVSNKIFLKQLEMLRVSKVIIYKTVFKKNLSKKTVQLIKNNKIKICLLYSQENAKRFIKLIHSHDLYKNAKNIVFLSLSKKIANYIINEGLSKSICALRPNQKSLIAKLGKSKVL
tara:strand:- start:870 stop:1589 length:720 start_codon:yes stop_codon:yes gene_type:complete